VYKVSLSVISPSTTNRDSYPFNFGEYGSIHVQSNSITTNVEIVPGPALNMSGVFYFLYPSIAYIKGNKNNIY
jgi:hypothetical protein